MASVKRTKHSAYLVFGILEEYRGRGKGFQQLEEWAIHLIIAVPISYHIFVSYFVSLNIEEGSRLLLWHYYLFTQ